MNNDEQKNLIERATTAAEKLAGDLERQRDEVLQCTGPGMDEGARVLNSAASAARRVLEALQMPPTRRGS